MSVLVYTENWDGKFKKLSFELVSYATRVAEMLNTSCIALSIGNVDDAELKKLGSYGAQKILSVNSDNLKVFDTQNYTEAIAQVAKNNDAKVVVISNNNVGKAVAPRLSVKLKAALAAGVNGLPLSTNPFTVRKRAFSGGAIAHVVLKTDVKIVTLPQNSVDVTETPVNAEVEKISISLPEPKTVVKDVQKQAGKLLLTDAEIVVSGGRGMKSPDNWGPLVELAELLGGATACSRPVSDEGWRPSEEHTGQTGKIIAPNLYIAVGISGATQHIAGVSGSKYIVAINNDKSAPIFEVAQYGIVGDAQKVLPKLVEAVREIKGK
ncbi:MAG: electron transfer flavoprotein subunit alpha/FixB family protein [Bacteroidales bacterium]|jgi:electron transfer flavoprotein alpha subunit|nr:electron transfer flavoprotein subunit alpha/FixB family protein [Bacteroidales bacterium]HNT41423.1 electron transfer flavoprotein subunit alpha/FixB family protein [Tenuifilaceae bacterium]MBP8643506.1 electron transfer flavoprotein subunit alpha/FixB family protein [Bacteroidales bacterium]HOA09814.1 electron transfer flavoprotein subunit alpha/FixB family protein [Tenuifilaceae bacterium]HOC36673.1 electron transfer flavoprotein subunit alpha/FixB family protein [Tenuifilaceae bacterium]